MDFYNQLFKPINFKNVNLNNLDDYFTIDTNKNPITEKQEKILYNCIGNSFQNIKLKPKFIRKEIPRYFTVPTSQSINSPNKILVLGKKEFIEEEELEYNSDLLTNILMKHSEYKENLKKSEERENAYNSYGELIEVVDLINTDSDSNKPKMPDKAPEVKTITMKYNFTIFEEQYVIDPNKINQKGRIICHICTKNDHISQLCPKRLKCSVCMNYGHKAINCVNQIKITCSFCYKNGHVTEDCLLRESESLTKPICFNCGQSGHFICCKNSCLNISDYEMKNSSSDEESNFDIKDCFKTLQNECISFTCPRCGGKHKIKDCMLLSDNDDLKFPSDHSIHFLSSNSPSDHITNDNPLSSSLDYDAPWN